MATLDRVQNFEDDLVRERHYRALLHEFRRELIAFYPTSDELPGGDPLELLARHHGVPSQLLDWTESPFIASFFAFETAGRSRSNTIAIWMFDLADFEPFESGVDLIENDPRDLRFNHRAWRQRGRFIRIRTTKRPVDQILGTSLVKILLPAAAAKIALACLDEMLINAATLFGDADGVARTASSRILP